jgi:hypothetical protein
MPEVDLLRLDPHQPENCEKSTRRSGSEMIVVTTGIVVICVVTLDGHGANKDVRRQFLKGAAADRVSDRPPPLTRAVGLVGLSDEHERAYGESRGFPGWHGTSNSAAAELRLGRQPAATTHPGGAFEDECAG